MTSTLEYYAHQLQDLNESKVSPYLSVLVLTILDMIDNGSIFENHICYDAELECGFEDAWSKYVGGTPKCSAVSAVWNFAKLPFCELHAEHESSLKARTTTPGANHLKELGGWFFLQGDFYQTLQSGKNRAKLRQALIVNNICHVKWASNEDNEDMVYLEEYEELEEENDALKQRVIELRNQLQMYKSIGDLDNQGEGAMNDAQILARDLVNRNRLIESMKTEMEELRKRITDKDEALKNLEEQLDEIKASSETVEQLSRLSEQHKKKIEELLNEVQEQKKQLDSLRTYNLLAQERETDYKKQIEMLYAEREQSTKLAEPNVAKTTPQSKEKSQAASKITNVRSITLQNPQEWPFTAWQALANWGLATQLLSIGEVRILDTLISSLKNVGYITPRILESAIKVLDKAIKEGFKASFLPNGTALIDQKKSAQNASPAYDPNHNYSIDKAWRITIMEWDNIITWNWQAQCLSSEQSTILSTLTSKKRTGIVFDNKEADKALKLIKQVNSLGYDTKRDYTKNPIKPEPANPKLKPSKNEPANLKLKGTPSSNEVQDNNLVKVNPIENPKENAQAKPVQRVDRPMPNIEEIPSEVWMELADWGSLPNNLSLNQCSQARLFGNLRKSKLRFSPVYVNNAINLWNEAKSKGFRTNYKLTSEQEASSITPQAEPEKKVDSTPKPVEISQYMKAFQSLNVSRLFGSPAPHKPVLLIAIINLIERRHYRTAVIMPGEVLENEFNAVWKSYVRKNSKYTCTYWTPFWYMKSEPFWSIVTRMGKELPSKDWMSEQEANKYMIGARLDSDLFTLMQSVINRAILKTALIDKYLR